jgi:hypothetical protein
MDNKNTGMVLSKIMPHGHPCLRYHVLLRESRAFPHFCLAALRWILCTTAAGTRSP